MIVLTIIGILASIAVPNYQRWVIRAKETTLSDSLNNFRKTIDEYYADQGKYPDTLADLVAKATCGACRPTLYQKQRYLDNGSSFRNRTPGVRSVSTAGNHSGQGTRQCLRCP
ncbi:MAG: type II secretion system GspH family protein [Desulfobacterales bacterium]|nr:type II secretion system GspH family protein [Desulfobacterales bacterium]